MGKSIVRILVVSCLLIISGVVVAQEYKKIGYESSIRLSYDVGIYGNYMNNNKITEISYYGKHRNNSYGVEYIAGYRHSDRLRYGAGIGIYGVDLCIEPGIYSIEYIDYERRWKFDNPEKREMILSFPFFFDVKYDFIQGRFSPYVQLDLGSQVHWAALSPMMRERWVDNSMTVFARPEFGFDVHFKRCTLVIGIAYKFQHRAYDCEKEDLKLRSYHQFSTIVGIEF